MKRFISLFCALLLMCGSLPTAGATLLSPALSLLYEEPSLTKCALVASDALFAASDFDTAFGTKVKKIRVDSLPDARFGVLLLDNKPIKEETVLSRKQLNKLILRPADNQPSAVSFKVSDVTDKNTSQAAVCTVHFMISLNLAPKTASQTVMTAKNIAVFAFLNANDPENDTLSIHVMQYPKHGTLRLDKTGSGYFSYVPKNGYTGKDSFSYVASDTYGNRSKETTVTVKITHPMTDVFYTDLADHWAHNDALRVSAMGLMHGNSDNTSFEPDSPVSRGDLLAMALIAAGYEPYIGFISHTGFADDDNIPINIKSYAEFARTRGIVTGYDTSAGIVFDSDAAVSRAEAAVMVSRILSLPQTETDIAVFADGAAAPDWAHDALARMTAAGLFNGTGFGELLPEAELSRAEAAALICHIVDYEK